MSVSYQPTAWTNFQLYLTTLRPTNTTSMESCALIVSVIVCLSISSGHIINIQFSVEGGHQMGGGKVLPQTKNLQDTQCYNDNFCETWVEYIFLIIKFFCLGMHILDLTPAAANTNHRNAMAIA